MNSNFEWFTGTVFSYNSFFLIFIAWFNFRFLLITFLFTYNILTCTAFFFIVAVDNLNDIITSVVSSLLAAVFWSFRNFYAIWQKTGTYSLSLLQLICSSIDSTSVLVSFALFLLEWKSSLDFALYSLLFFELLSVLLADVLLLLFCSLIVNSSSLLIWLFRLLLPSFALLLFELIWFYYICKDCFPIYATKKW